MYSYQISINLTTRVFQFVLFLFSPLGLLFSWSKYFVLPFPIDVTLALYKPNNLGLLLHDIYPMYINTCMTRTAMVTVLMFTSVGTDNNDPNDENSNVSSSSVTTDLQWMWLFWPNVKIYLHLFPDLGGGWGCEVSCGGHHRPREKTTTGSALDGAMFDIAQILAYLVHNMNRSQLYLGFGHFGWLPSFFGQWHFGGLMVKLYFLCWNYSLSSGWHIIAA